MSTHQFSAFTTDLDRSPELRTRLERHAARFGTVETLLTDGGKVTTYKAVAA